MSQNCNAKTLDAHKFAVIEYTLLAGQCLFTQNKNHSFLKHRKRNEKKPIKREFGSIMFGRESSFTFEYDRQIAG
jgi:hypothetical protein